MKSWYAIVGMACLQSTDDTWECSVNSRTTPNASVRGCLSPIRHEPRKPRKGSVQSDKTESQSQKGKSWKASGKRQRPASETAESQNLDLGCHPWPDRESKDRRVDLRPSLGRNEFRPSYPAVAGGAFFLPECSAEARSPPDLAAPVQAVFAGVAKFLKPQPSNSPGTAS